MGQKQREEERREDRKVCPPPPTPCRELKQQFSGYKVKKHNIIIDPLDGWSQEMDTTIRKIVGSRSKEVLKRMQEAVLSGTSNIDRTIHCYRTILCCCCCCCFFILSKAMFGFFFCDDI